MKRIVFMRRMVTLEGGTKVPGLDHSWIEKLIPDVGGTKTFKHVKMMMVEIRLRLKII